MLTSRQYDEAIRLYTEAISLNANNAIFFSNRAAAYSHLGKHAQAIEDCNKALSIDINYAKAYSRLGLAHFSTGNYQQAVAAYKRAVELEPGNALAQESLQAAQARLEEENAPKPAAPTPAAGGFDPAMMANMANMFGGAGAGGAPGGMGGLGALLNNPQFMNMAQGLMQDPQFMNMFVYKNPLDTGTDRMVFYNWVFVTALGLKI
jgi:small glutamine-rich tetratricopeptide repeat-containing protein alpha